MRRLLRWLALSLGGLVLLSFVAAAAGYLWLRQSLPQVDGAIEVAGLAAPVDRARCLGDPHIEAVRLLDASFALGFVHAQDRLWQMEFQRRLGAGRLAEILGAAALSSDRFMRTLGLYRQAEASLARWTRTRLRGSRPMPPASTPSSRRTGPLPPEFLILGHGKVEPWRPTDSLVWLRVMALDLATNYGDELARARLARRLSKEQIADLWPPYPDNAPITLAELARALPWDQLAAVLPRLRAASARMPGWWAPRVRPPAGRCSRTIPIFTCRHPACGTSRTSRPRARAGRGDLARPSGGRARAQRRHRVGLHQHRRRYPGSVHRTGRSRDPTRYLTPVVRHRSPCAKRSSRWRAARGWRSACAQPGTGRLSLTFCRTPRPRLAPTSSWRSPGARPAKTIWPSGRCSASIGHGIGAGSSRRCARWARRCRTSLCRCLGSHRLHCAPGGVPIRKRGDGRWPVPGWSRRIRLDGMGPVRCRAAGARSCGQYAVQREQPHRAARTIRPC